MMEFRFQSFPPIPTPGLKSSWRPLIPIEITGPTGKSRTSRHALIDSGADDTLFPRLTADQIAIPLRSDAGLGIRWRGQPYRFRFGEVEFALTDGITSLRWKATVGFSDAPLRYPLLGQSGFLQYFDVTFLGADRIVRIAPNPTFVSLP